MEIYLEWNNCKYNEICIEYVIFRIKVLLVCGNIICIYIRVLDLGMYKLKVIFDISIEVDSNFLFEYLLDLIIILIEFVELKFIGR